MRMRLTRTSCGAALLELSAECHREKERERGGEGPTHKVYVQCKRGSYFDYCFRASVCVRCAWHCFDSFAFLGSLSQALYVHTQRERARERGADKILVLCAAVFIAICCLLCMLYAPAYVAFM